MKLQVNVPDELDEHIQELVKQTVAKLLKDTQHSNSFADYLNLGEAADYLSISRGTLTKVIKEDGLPVTYIGRSSRIKKSDLDKYMTEKAI